MKKLDLKKLTDELEETAQELWRRREEAALQLGFEMHDINSDHAIAPSVEFKTPYGSLVLSQSRDGYRAHLNETHVSYMDVFTDDDENDTYDQDQDMGSEIADVINSPVHEMAWRCAAFVKQHENLFKNSMVKETQEG